MAIAKMSTLDVIGFGQRWLWSASEAQLNSHELHENNLGL